MAKELSEDTNVQVSLKTLGGIAALIATIVGMWFALQETLKKIKYYPFLPHLQLQGWNLT